MSISDQGVKLKNFVIIVQSTKESDLHATNLETCLIHEAYVSVLCAD